MQIAAKILNTTWMPTLPILPNGLTTTIWPFALQFGFQFGLYRVVAPLSFFYVVSALHYCLLVFLFLADQIFYSRTVRRQAAFSFAVLCIIMFNSEIHRNRSLYCLEAIEGCKPAKVLSLLLIAKNLIVKIPSSIEVFSLSRIWLRMSISNHWLRNWIKELAC